MRFFIHETRDIAWIQRKSSFFNNIIKSIGLYYKSIYIFKSRWLNCAAAVIMRPRKCVQVNRVLRCKNNECGPRYRWSPEHFMSTWRHSAWKWSVSQEKKAINQLGHNKLLTKWFQRVNRWRLLVRLDSLLHLVLEADRAWQLLWPMEWLPFNLLPIDSPCQRGFQGNSSIYNVSVSEVVYQWFASKHQDVEASLADDLPLPLLLLVVHQAVWCLWRIHVPYAISSGNKQLLSSLSTSLPKPAVLLPSLLRSYHRLLAKSSRICSSSFTACWNLSISLETSSKRKCLLSYVHWGTILVYGLKSVNPIDYHCYFVKFESNSTRFLF